MAESVYDLTTEDDIEETAPEPQVEPELETESDIDLPAAAKGSRPSAAAPIRQTARKAIEKYRELSDAAPTDITAAALVLGCRDDAGEVTIAVLSAARVPTKLLDRLDQIAGSEDPMDAVVEVMGLDGAELKRVGALLSAIGVEGQFTGGDTTKQVKAIARAAFDQSAQVRQATTRLRAIIRK